MIRDRELGCPPREGCHTEGPRRGLEPKGKDCPSLEECVGWGRVSQPGWENPEPLTLRGAHTDHLVLGVGDSELLQLSWGEGFYRCLSLRLCPRWLLIQWFRPCSLKAWQSGPRRGGSSGRAGVSQAGVQGTQGGWMRDKRRRCRSRGFV